MTVVVDSGFVLALARRRDPRHAEAVGILAELDEDLVTSPLALADLDRSVADALGDEARHAVWRDFERGAYAVRWWADALKETLAIAGDHPGLGLATASLVALAGRVNTRRVATFDEQFRTLTTPDGEAFVVLPADR
ncbi:PIN domain-containing protein [Baekduia soli]|uniref:Ribonuclease VapC n=1 Tax=Baekduia soli TaxID=496014 RepID=A0A5B8U2B4_9ACTN|nr:PIN domain-containing protein [Baekduia soli]QEC47098.1 PIN domain-containing protein [Baekduia soli]